MNRTTQQRSVKNVPRACVWVLGTALVLQLLWHTWLPDPQVRAMALPRPPPDGYLRLLGFGEPAVLSRLVSLWLQAFDNQPGISIPFVALDYERVTGWLRVSLRLDPGNSYPLLVASHLYTEVPDAAKVRRMLAFIESEFKLDPQARWRWMANAVLTAKHRLGDLPLALALARQLTDADAKIPGWARQMQIFVLEDLGELEAAEILLGGMLSSGSITSAHERIFLDQRLETLREAIAKRSVEK
ncbi:MAG: hypothetical protein OET44_04690 [Gammaproteobacteria bacterium]|nr:hypothetical protein [Gammaproteobacteria bacterium]